MLLVHLFDMMRFQTYTPRNQPLSDQCRRRYLRSSAKGLDQDLDDLFVGGHA